MNKIVPIVCGLALFASAGIASAAPVNSDVRVVFSAPSVAQINTPAVYTATVSNAGPATATGISLTITLPLTNTSPSTSILGNVSGLDSRCSLVNKQIVCSLGSLKKGKFTNVSYSYTAPVANKPLTMTGVVAAAGNDPQTGNNTSSVVPNLAYPDRAISSTTNTVVNNSHCTGTNLVAYFECLLYPSSIASHAVTFNAGGTISFTDPDYTGSWSQPTLHQLRFEYFDLSGKVLEFNGFAINGSSCFDGISTFFPTSTYNSAYRVCI